MHNSYLAAGAAALAAWIFGAVYYGVLGKAWQRAQGLDPEACKGQKMPIAPMVTSLVCELVMAISLLKLFILPWRLAWEQGLLAGLWVGVAFVASTILVNNMFQQRKLMLTVIDSVHWIGVLMIECVILSLLL